jgi:hypothetical protein
MQAMSGSAKRLGVKAEGLLYSQAAGELILLNAVQGDARCRHRIRILPR